MLWTWTKFWLQVGLYEGNEFLMNEKFKCLLVHSSRQSYFVTERILETLLIEAIFQRDCSQEALSFIALPSLGEYIKCSSRALHAQLRSKSELAPPIYSVQAESSSLIHENNTWQGKPALRIRRTGKFKFYGKNSSWEFSQMQESGVLVFYTQKKIKSKSKSWEKDNKR